MCVLLAGMHPAAAAIPTAPWHPRLLDRLKTLGMLPLWANVSHPAPAFELQGPTLSPPPLRLGTHGASFGLSTPYAVYAQPQGINWALGWENDSSLAFLATRVGPISITAGRTALAWGPNSAGGLLFADSSGPFDLVQVRWQWRALHASRVLGWLDGGRSLIATRFDISIRRNLRLGFGESILMKGAPYLPYLLAPMPFLFNQYVSERYRGFIDNHLLSFDAEWIPRPGLRLFGELLIDDFTVPTPTANFPSRWGLTIGLHWANPNDDREFRAAYTIVPNWTYSAADPDEHYQLRGRPLGHPLGADFDMLHLRWANSATRAVWTSLIRKGEGQVGRMWMDEAEARQFIFLRGVVEYSIILGVDWGAGRTGEWSAVLSPWIAYRSNAGHVAGTTRLDGGLGLQFSKSY